MGKILKDKAKINKDPKVKAAKSKLAAARAKATAHGASQSLAAKKDRGAVIMAKAAVTRAKRQAGASIYRNDIKGRRAAVKAAFANCKSEACAKALRKVVRLPATKGEWQTATGLPGIAGESVWVPTPQPVVTPLITALMTHGQKGVPFNDGFPVFTLFPPKGMTTVHQVQITMAGNSSSDITAAENALIAAGGPNTKGSGQPGTWHHEPDGATMSYVDMRVHTAYKSGTVQNPGVPHAGGDLMTRSPEF